MTVKLEEKSFTIFSTAVSEFSNFWEGVEGRRASFFEFVTTNELSVMGGWALLFLVGWHVFYRKIKAVVRKDILP